MALLASPYFYDDELMVPCPCNSGVYHLN